MKWRILREQHADGDDDLWQTTGETFEHDLDAVNARLDELRAATGSCHAAEYIGDA